MDIPNAVVLDLAKAAVGACAGAAFALLFRKVLKPAFEQLFLEKRRLRRDWTGVIRWPDVGEHTLQVSLRKLGYTVSGRLLFTTGVHQGKAYRLTGRFAHGTLTFTYWPVDAASVSQGSGTFLLLNDGERLAGAFAYHGQTSNAVETIACELAALGATPHA